MTAKSKVTVTEHGVSSLSQSVQTSAFQQIIDACASAGGDVIEVPTGRYVIGSIRLRSNITLRLKAGAVLVGSANLNDYTDFNEANPVDYVHDPFYIKEWHLPDHYFAALISAYHERNVQIIAESGSAIDGSSLTDSRGEEGFRGPMGIAMVGVSQLTLKGYTFVNSANWSHALLGCHHVTIDDVQIRGGHDGFNLHHSRDIRISNCGVYSGDDTIAGYDIHRLTVRHCLLNTACNSMRIGGQEIQFDDCTFSGPGLYPHLAKQTNYTHAFFKYYAIDADKNQQPSENITIKRCLINDIGRLISYNRGDKSVMQNGSYMRTLTFDSCVIDHVSAPSVIHGNGTALTVTFTHVQFGHNEATQLLQLDSSVAVILEDVTFLEPTMIKQGTDTCSLCGHVTRMVLSDNG